MTKVYELEAKSTFFVKADSPEGAINEVASLDFENVRHSVLLGWVSIDSITDPVEQSEEEG